MDRRIQVFGRFLMFLCTHAHAYEYTYACEKFMCACEYTCVTCTGPCGAPCSSKFFDRVAWLTLVANDVTEGLEGDGGLDGTSTCLDTFEESGHSLASPLAFEYQGQVGTRVLRLYLLTTQNRVLHSVGMTKLVGFVQPALVSTRHFVPKPTFSNNCFLLASILAGMGEVLPPSYPLVATPVWQKSCVTHRKWCTGLRQ